MSQASDSLVYVEGVKFDQDKIRMELIPPEVMVALGHVLTYGASKYEARNWEKGMDWGRVLGAMKRHMTQWELGEEGDEETGYSHLWHALTCLAFLVTYEARAIGEPTIGPNADT